MNPIPVLRPDMPSADELLPYLRRIDAAQQFANFGPLCLELERRLSADCSSASGHPVALTTVANCTVGLQLALMASVDRPRVKVLVPSLTFPGTVSGILQAGFEPVLADIDPSRWVLTPEIARAAMARVRGIRAIMPVAAFGGALDVQGWDQLTLETGVPVVIDAAGAFGNQTVGAHTVVAFSMHATKALGAGEGGFVAARDPEVVARVRRLSNFGYMSAGGLISDIGVNGKMSEYAAAVGLAALDRWPAVSTARRVLMSSYSAAVQDACPEIVLQERPLGGVYSLGLVRLPDRLRAETVAEFLASRGIGSRRWYCPGIYAHPAFLALTQADDHVVVKHLDQHLLGLPFHLQMSLADIDRVTGALQAVLALGERGRSSVAKATRSPSSRGAHLRAVV
ncbi:MAG: DegT/DnrJ/EryC1/StrS aminotransferase family protein [Proteobacteria bacterium]|nr:DegT/DnrJ/EryC1/StrS aminotransferase family protein [Burkholderiales bacterium]